MFDAFKKLSRLVRSLCRSSPLPIRFQRPSLEVLESREVPAGTIATSLIGDVLQIQGDAANNNLSLSLVRVNGQESVQVSSDNVVRSTHSYATVKAITVELRGGNDTVLTGMSVLPDRGVTYLFDTDSQLGSDTINEIFGGGTVSFASSALGCTLNLGSFSQQTVNQNLKLTLANSTTRGVVSGAGNDRFTGSLSSNTFAFNTSTQQGSDVVTDTSGLFGASNTIDFSGSSFGATLNLGLATQQTVNSNLRLTLVGSGAYGAVVGGEGGDRFTGTAANNYFTGNGGDDEMIGNGGADSYFFNASRLLGVDRIIDTSGLATVSFIGSSIGCELNLSRTDSQIVNANLRLTLSDTAGIRDMVGGNGNDAFGGNGRDNTFTGNGGNDVYYVMSNALVTQGRDVIVDSGGINSVDFLYSSAGCTFNLSSAGTDQQVNPTLRLRLSVGGIRQIAGSEYADTFVGSTNGDVINGRGGNDTITGGGQRSILVGGQGNDTIIGGARGDILIQGVTTFDQDTNLPVDYVAFNAILTEWGSTKNIVTRKANLTLIGITDTLGRRIVLDWGTTVLNDQGQNVLRGQPVGVPEPGGEEFDAFFADSRIGHDTMPDRVIEELFRGQ